LKNCGACREAPRVSIAFGSLRFDPPMDVTETTQPQVSIIVPARNEEASLGSCLESLVAQAGVSMEIIVVDDHSTDRTREIANSFGGVHLMEAEPLAPDWTGKNNAVTTGARAARGSWLLFTDADTVHLPGSLARTLSEAEQHGADLLSYSPEQIAVTFWEMATLPVVFAELARQYPPSKVSDPNSPDAAANGQYLLVRREAYESVGGHAAVASDILEDVALARAFKAAGLKIRFRYAADAVRTRMYRNFRQLREGWTKNLALLFPNPGWLAAKTLANWVMPGILIATPIGLGILANSLKHAGLVKWLGMISGRNQYSLWWTVPGSLWFARNTAVLRRANFDLVMEFLGALFGMPMFAYLLLRSKRLHARGDVSWKGRTYGSNNNLMKNTSEQTTVPSGKLA
jgi:glycosyltransferase involved in cell wall biosynthesis